MAGEELDAVNVTERGLLGDRVYALVDPESNRAAVPATISRIGRSLKRGMPGQGPAASANSARAVAAASSPDQ